MVEQYESPFQIVGSSVKSLKIKNDFISLKNLSNIKKTIDISHTISDVGIHSNESLFSGLVTMNIKVTLSEKKKRYQVELSIEGCFAAERDSMDENTFKEMLRINGLTSLYSIARGFIQGTTAQTLTVGSVLLPMLNIAAYSRDLESEDKND